MWDILKPLRSRGDKQRPESPVRIKLAQVNFKDLNLSVDDDEEEDMEGTGAEGVVAGSSEASSPRISAKAKRIVRTKQVIIMVGLPGRGKTFLCNKLKCYLNWLGHNTKHINVGSYRRLQKHEGELQSADFFDHSNQHGTQMRNKALQAALDDLHAYLASDEGQVVIFDATNTTEERRKKLVAQFHGRYQYLFIESICNDPKVLEQNYMFKMRYSPDYQGMSTDEAIQDFRNRVKKYEEVYEPLIDRNVHYIKLIDMVTGRGHMDVNRISGYIPGKIVFFLMQICKAGMAQSRKIWLTRHGESEFNVKGLIGGDSQLSGRGEDYARRLPDLLIDRLPLTFDEQSIPVSVWTSTLKRTIQTASYLPFPKLRWKALDEIHAGACDGLSYAQIEQRFPEEYAARGADKLRYRYPAGESYLDVIQRLEPVIIEMERERECVCVVGHQAVLRAILGYFTNAPLKDIPTLEVPLHTLIELRPRPDGTMAIEMIPARIGTAQGEDVTKVQYYPTHLPPPGPPVQVPLGTTGEQVINRAMSRRSTPGNAIIPGTTSGTGSPVKEQAPRHKRSSSLGGPTVAAAGGEGHGLSGAIAAMAAAAMATTRPVVAVLTGRSSHDQQQQQQQQQASTSGLSGEAGAATGSGTGTGAGTPPRFGSLSLREVTPGSPSSLAAFGAGAGAGAGAFSWPVGPHSAAAATAVAIGSGGAVPSVSPRNSMSIGRGGGGGPSPSSSPSPSSAPSILQQLAQMAFPLRSSPESSALPSPRRGAPGLPPLPSSRPQSGVGAAAMSRRASSEEQQLQQQQQQQQ